MDYNQLANNFKELLSKYKRVTIISHKRADGDTVSSALALYNTLKNAGTTSELVCIDKDLPKKFSFIDGFDRYKDKINYTDSLIVTLDCADLSRVGFDLAGREVVNIDHHKSNSNFGNLNIVELEVSTTAVLYKLLKEAFKIDKKVAEALYAGLLSDSQNFTTTLTTKDSFKIAMELIELGVEPTKVANYVNRFNSLAHIRVLAKAIESMQLFVDGTVAIMEITKENIKATGARYSDIIGVVDSAISLATVEVAILIVEFEDEFKLSLRSKNVDISKVAIKFGGGGHKNAAGFEVKDSKILDIKDKLIEELKDYR